MIKSASSPLPLSGLVAAGHSLFGSGFAAAHKVQQGQIAVIGMPSDWTHSSRIGTRFGPDALRKATTHLWATRPQSTWFDPDRRIWGCERLGWIVDCGDAAIAPDDVAATTQAIAAKTEAVTRAGGIPLALGGDHYTSFPACLGFSRAIAAQNPRARIGYIQIDGHLDFSDSLGAWGSHNHATNARRISELANVDLANMVWIGITGWVDGEELALIDAGGGKVLSSQDVHERGAAAIMAEAVDHAMRDCDVLYLSIDIDAMDAGFLPGTGSIVHSGITPRQYYDLLDGLAGAPLRGLDIVEVAPSLDPSGRSPLLAGQMLVHALQAFHTEIVDQP